MVLRHSADVLKNFAKCSSSLGQGALYAISFKQLAHALALASCAHSTRSLQRKSRYVRVINQ